MAAYGNATGRAKVTFESFLDVDSHWRTILQSIFRNNETRPLTVDLDQFCVVGLRRDHPNHGVVIGDIHNPQLRRLVVLNTGDVHFDPCLRLD